MQIGQFECKWITLEVMENLVSDHRCRRHWSKRLEKSIRTPAGVARIRAKESAEKLEALAEAFYRCGTVKAAANQAGIDRRIATDYLERMGLHDPGEGMKNRFKTTYTHAVTERSITTLYSWGAVHHCVQLYDREVLGTREVSEITGIPRATLPRVLSARLFGRRRRGRRRRRPCSIEGQTRKSPDRS